MLELVPAELGVVVHFAGLLLIQKRLFVRAESGEHFCGALLGRVEVDDGFAAEDGHELVDALLRLLDLLKVVCWFLKEQAVPEADTSFQVLMLSQPSSSRESGELVPPFFLREASRCEGLTNIGQIVQLIDRVCFAQLIYDFLPDSWLALAGVLLGDLGDHFGDFENFRGFDH